LVIGPLAFTLALSAPSRFAGNIRLGPDSPATRTQSAALRERTHERLNAHSGKLRHYCWFCCNFEFSGTSEVLTRWGSGEQRNRKGS
jgi:hypothetical protein